MTKGKATPRITSTQLAKEFRAHDKWERARDAQEDQRRAEDQERIVALERAIVQINHFTESIETLKLPEWKAEINADLKWMKYLLGAGAAAGLFGAIAQIIAALKGV